MSYCGNMKVSCTDGASHDHEGKPYSEVRDYVGQLEAQADRLNTVLQNLRTRLDSVMKPEPPTGGEKAGLISVSPSSPLAIQLRNVLDSNSTTITQLIDLIDRLQI